MDPNLAAVAQPIEPTPAPRRRLGTVGGVLLVIGALFPVVSIFVADSRTGFSGSAGDALSRFVPPLVAAALLLLAGLSALRGRWRPVAAGAALAVLGQVAVLVWQLAAVFLPDTKVSSQQWLGLVTLVLASVGALLVLAVTAKGSFARAAFRPGWLLALIGPVALAYAAFQDWGTVTPQTNGTATGLSQGCCSLFDADYTTAALNVGAAVLVLGVLVLTALATVLVDRSARALTLFGLGLVVAGVLTWVLPYLNRNFQTYVSAGFRLAPGWYVAALGALVLLIAGVLAAIAPPTTDAPPATEVTEGAPAGITTSESAEPSEQ